MATSLRAHSPDLDQQIPLQVDKASPHRGGGLPQVVLSDQGHASGQVEMITPMVRHAVAAAALSLIRVLARLTGMPNKDRPLVDRHPPKPGGEDWLVNAQEQLVVQFKPDNPSPHAEWVSVRTYSWVPPHPPMPQTRRRMLRHNGIDAWKQIQKTGCQRCSPPVR